MTATHDGADRAHLVLVPGFAGFDALGQIHYYAGVTPLFRRWQERGQRGRLALHYFDSFPTAGVAVRARRLQAFLARRLARGEIGPGEPVVLVGHSTGGLDIRKLLHELARKPQEPNRVDGDPVGPTNQEILDSVRRVVFLSVPHFGTNIADAARRLQGTLTEQLKEVASGLWLNRGLPARLRGWLAERVDTGSELLVAIGDALDETDLVIPPPQARDLEPEAGANQSLAGEREARAELAVWIDHMVHDFGALVDLTPRPDQPDDASPAHFSDGARKRELELWRERGVRVLSLATRARTPEPDAKLGALVKALRLGSALVNVGAHLPVVGGLGRAALLALLHSRPRLAFDVCHAVCADPGGPFRDPGLHDGMAVVPLTAEGPGSSPVEPGAISEADNDGIVNTLSMLWPPGGKAYLVQGDHADIIGHYRRRSTAAPGEGAAGRRGRSREAYDIFQSESEFNDAVFTRVWELILDFAVAPG